MDYVAVNVDRKLGRKRGKTHSKGLQVRLTPEPSFSSRVAACSPTELKWHANNPPFKTACKKEAKVSAEPINNYKEQKKAKCI